VSTETANAAVVGAFYESVKRGDFATATAVFADDLTWVEPPFPGFEGGTFHGKENVLANVLGVFLATWTDLAVTPERITPAGELVIVHGTYAGRHKRTGRPFEARFVHTWTLRDGKGVRFEMLTDTVQMFRTVWPDDRAGSGAGGV
jgi:ketosteroid isomerase-like protein